MRRINMMLAVALALTSLASLQAAPPATTTSPSAAKVDVAPQTPDFSEPKKTLLTLARANMKGDIAGVRMCYMISDLAKEPMDGLFAFSDASFKLRQVVREKYGDKAVADFLTGSPMEDPAKLSELLRNSKESVYGPDKMYIELENKATASTLAPQTMLYFRRIGKEWKIDAAAMFRLDRPDSAKEVAKQTVMIKALAGVFEEVTHNVQKGKFADAREVQAALGQKIQMAMIDMEEQAKRSATPATEPEKK